MQEGTPYVAAVATKKGAMVLSVAGKLCAPSKDDTSFFEFVVNRPHKFLAQCRSQGEPTRDCAKQLVFASWREGAYDCTATGCMLLRVDTVIEVEAILRRIFDDDAMEQLKQSYVVCHFAVLCTVLLQIGVCTASSKNSFRNCAHIDLCIAMTSTRRQQDQPPPSLIAFLQPEYSIVDTINAPVPRQSKDETENASSVGT